MRSLKDRLKSTWRTSKIATTVRSRHLCWTQHAVQLWKVDGFMCRTRRGLYHPQAHPRFACEPLVIQNPYLLTFHAVAKPCRTTAASRLAQVKSSQVRQSPRFWKSHNSEQNRTEQKFCTRSIDLTSIKIFLTDARVWGPPNQQTLLGVVASEVEPPHAPHACGATWLESACYLDRLTPQLGGWQAFVSDSSFIVEGSFTRFCVCLKRGTGTRKRCWGPERFGAPSALLPWVWSCLLCSQRLRSTHQVSISCVFCPPTPPYSSILECHNGQGHK